MSRYALLTYSGSCGRWMRRVLFHPDVLACTPGLTAHVAAERNERLDRLLATAEGTCAGSYYDVSHEEWTAASRAEDRAAYVFRDPRDRLIAWALASTERPALHGLDLRDRLRLAMLPTGDTAIWIARTWLDTRGMPRYRAVSFERIATDPVAEFGAIFAFFGWDVPAPLVRGVIARDPLVPRAPCGSWRSYFDRELGDLFERVFPGLLVDLGYEADGDWFASLPETSERLAGDDALYELRRRNVVLEAGFAAQREVIEAFQAIVGNAIS